MANSNFIVQNGLTVGSLTIDATTSNITLPSGSAIYVGGAAITPGGTSNFSSQTISGNSTVNALTVNASATIGTTLGVAGQITSTLADGTAPFAITSTTKVVNLNADRVDDYSAATANTASTLAVRDSSGNISANGVTVASTMTVGGLGFDGATSTINSTSTTITIDPASAGVGGQVVVAGNLYVTGTTFTVDSQTITVNDKDIVVANNQSTAAGIDGAGIIAGNVSVGGGIAKFIYNNATSSWQSNVAMTPAANATLAFGGTANYWGSGYFSSISAPQITGVLQTASQTNITSVGTLTSLTLSGTLTGTTINAATIGNTGAAITGTLQTASQTNITAVGTLTSVVVAGTSTLNGTVTLNNILPSANANANIGSTASQFNTIFAKATSAQYADLAENYEADAVYAPGTVVVFGGDEEITISNQTHDTRVAGVVSTNPAYLMNSGLKNATPVAFTGRVPCKVRGPVTKGQLVVQGMNWGIAEALNPDYFAPGCVLGKALGEIADNSIQTIEVVVGRF